MKQYIYKINQYLLEKYPTIWNTRLVWMLVISICFHLFFFLLGVFALTNPETLQEKRSINVFFDSGIVFFSIVISILQIVVWLIYMFKNNSFKNYYPTSKTKIFSQFICYLVIAFFTTSYILSHYAGLKTYINYKYPDNELKNDIDIANKASVFFSHSVNDYTINNCRYPFPFNDIYVERSQIYHSEPYYEWLDNSYQFCTLEIRSSKNIKGDEPVKGYKFYEEINNRETLYFFRDSVVDILGYKTNVDAISDYVLYSENNFYKDSTYRKYKGIKMKVPTGDITYAGFIKYRNKDTLLAKYYEDDKKDIKEYKINVEPSYKYYSSTFYSTEYNKYKYMYNTGRNKFEDKKSKEVYQLLKRNDTTEIKQLLNLFLATANKYKIKNNISVSQWFKLIYQPDHFKVTSFIKKGTGYSKIQQTVKFSKQEISQTEKFQYEHTTDYFIETNRLVRVFENIEGVKKNTDYKETFLVLLWLSFFLSVLIFMFRISGLKTFIFTIISVCLLAILVALLSFSHKYFFGGGFWNNNIISIISFIISFSIVITSILFTEKLRKKVMAVFINLSLSAFLLCVVLIVDLISSYQRYNCYQVSIKDCFILIKELGVWFGYIVFIAGIIYLYFFSDVIKKWKGLPER